MKKRIAINGFGRIGRLAFRIMQQHDDLEVVAINDLTDTRTLAHLLKYDSVHRGFEGEVSALDDGILVNGKEIKIFSERDPRQLPWKSLDVDVVLESTGVFRSKEQLAYHLDAGAKKVVLSAPAKGKVKTIVLGVNDEALTDEDLILSNASCTTNCLAPMAKIIDEKWGIINGHMTTVHAYTADQRLQDAPHSDLRRARAAALSIIPTSTGAAKAVSKVLPNLEGKLDGVALRVPTPTGSLTDLTVRLEKKATAEEINRAIKEAAENEMKGILQYTEDPIVSADIMGSPYSCIFDAQLTNVQGSLLKVMGWYDNEAGYSHRAVDLIRKIS
jgi:glyceraldehyde 3-phosphate dehydrogenase